MQNAECRMQNGHGRASLILLLAAVGLLALIAVGLLSWMSIGKRMAPPKKLYYADGFTPEKFSRVRLGMTAQQVRHLLGEPVGRSLNAPASPGKFPEVWYYSCTGGSDPVPERQHFVEFDRNGRVIGVAWPWR